MESITVIVPFFNEEQYVSPNNPSWGSSCNVDQVVQIKKRTINLSQPPLKYNFALTPNYVNNKDDGNLLKLGQEPLEINSPEFESVYVDHEVEEMKNVYQIDDFFRSK